MAGQDFVPEGSPSGWYVNPDDRRDYFWTGRGFATVEGRFVSRDHPRGAPDFEPSDVQHVSAWVAEHGVHSISEERLSIPVTTLHYVPGFEVSEILGLVQGVGNVALSMASVDVALTTAGKAVRAMEKAEEELRLDAYALKADAVIAVCVATDSSGNTLNRSQTLQLVGTAVRLRKRESSNEEEPQGFPAG